MSRYDWGFFEPTVFISSLLALQIQEKHVLIMQITFQELASMPHALSSSGQITRPKPLLYRNPEVSTEAWYEFLGTTPLNEFSISTV